MITSDDWKRSLSAVQSYALEKLPQKFKYSQESLKLDHACPPPIPELNQSEYETDTCWQQQRVLWCFPAAPHQGSKLNKKNRIPLHSLGTTLWTVIYALKQCGLEDHISVENIEKLKEISFSHKNGIAQAFVELGWARGVYTDPQLAQPGDVGVIRYSDEKPHHWFVVVEPPVQEINKQNVVNTWSASEYCNGFGYDYWLFDKTKDEKKREWVLTNPFSI